MATFAIAMALWAQDRGTVTGTIADPAGAVVPNAPIELKNEATGATYQAASTETGNYTLTGLPAGAYEQTVTVNGFKKYVRKGIVVQVAQTVRVDVALEVGSSTESVTVTEAVTLLKTESGELSHTVTSQRLNDLPILGIGGSYSSAQGLRYYMSQVQLAPGAYFAPGGLNVKVNGAPNNTQRTQIEGMDATNSLISFSQYSLQPSVDAVQETAIQTSNFAAEFGQVGGGLVNVTMKSGTNQFHGNAFLYNANEAYNASSPYLKVKPRLRRNNYGFNISGPITIPKIFNGKDKAFFFYNREQFREEGTIFDPASTTTAANGNVYRNPFPNNIIPASRIDRVSAAIQNLIPLPGSSGLAST